jgi:hypothetical protein
MLLGLRKDLLHTASSAEFDNLTKQIMTVERVSPEKFPSQNIHLCEFSSISKLFGTDAKLYLSILCPLSRCRFVPEKVNYSLYDYLSLITARSRRDFVRIICRILMKK